MSYPNEGCNGETKQRDEQQPKGYVLQTKENRRPRKVQSHLACPEDFECLIGRFDPDAPSGSADKDVKHCPGWGENPIWRVERRFIKTSVPVAWKIHPAYEPADQDDTSNEKCKF